MCCFYVLKNTSNMTCPTMWYNDIVYSDHVVCIHAFGKHFFPLLLQSPNVERYGKDKKQ